MLLISSYLLGSHSLSALCLSPCCHIDIAVGMIYDSGNDGLGEMGILDRPATTHKDVLTTMRGLTKKFEERYTRIIDQIIELKKPLCVCTVYDPFFKFERPDSRLPLGVDFTQEAYVIPSHLHLSGWLCTSPSCVTE
jgi:hypothetical protein